MNSAPTVDQLLTTVYYLLNDTAELSNTDSKLDKLIETN